MRSIDVRQHDDGTWYTRIYQGVDPVTGKQLRKYKRFPEASDEAEALEMARAWASSLPAGGAESTRLVDVLNRYVAALPGMGLAANTCKAYAGIVRRDIAPNVGNVGADELRPRHVEELYAKLLARGLSPATVNQVHWFLRGAYRWIVRNDLSPFDPMRSVGHPRAPQAEAVSFGGDTFEKVDRELSLWLLGKKKGPKGKGADPTFPRNAAMAAYLALWTGMRCGECCAVTVEDFSIEGMRLHVAGTVIERKGVGAELQRMTKGRRSRNVAMTDNLARAGADHMLWCARFLPERERSRASRTVCCTASGGLLRPSDVSEWFGERARSIGLPAGMTFHTLRHMHATYLLHAGVDMRTVQERLGHADVSTTLRLYAHVLPGRDREAAEALGRIAAEGPGNRGRDEENASGGAAKSVPIAPPGGAPNGTLRERDELQKEGGG